MNQRIQNLVTYIAQVDPRAVNKLAYEYGFVVPTTQEGRMGLMFTGLVEEGDTFLRSMAKHHPDRELILNADGANVEPNVIDLSAAKPASTLTTEKPLDVKNDTLRLVVIVIIVFVIYSIFQKK